MDSTLLNRKVECDICKMLGCYGLDNGREIRPLLLQRLLTLESKYSLFALLATGEARVADRTKDEASIEG